MTYNELAIAPVGEGELCTIPPSINTFFHIILTQCFISRNK